jgi:hypothetical protein
MRKLFTLTFIVLLAASAALAQSAHTPEKGSPERKAILDALRIPVEKRLKQKVIFATDNFNVAGNWAFIAGQPQTPEGGRLDYSHTSYAEAVSAGMFDSNIFALLKKAAGGWKVVTFQIGCTDVCYLPWQKQYKAPKAVFPYTE